MNETPDERRPVGDAGDEVDVNDEAGEQASPIIVRPDGYYWQAPDGHQEFGPFETLSLARANRDGTTEAGLAPIESLHEAEREIGIADWIDAETGEPAEGGSPPHLPEE